MTFDPFGDFETEGYLQNSLKLKDPLEVKESEHLSFIRAWMIPRFSDFIKRIEQRLLNDPRSPWCRC